MSEKEKKILETIATAVPKMSEFDKSWNQISEDMNYNVRYLFHIHGAALNEFYQMYEQEINANV